MKTLKIRKSIQADILPIAVNMREDDVKEVWDSNLYSPYKALRKGYTKGNSWTIIVNGVPIGMIGVARGTLLSDRGIPWLLGTDALVDDRKLFLRVSRVILKKMGEGYKMLENYVSVENKASFCWLRHLGFKIGEEVKSVTGVIFKRFYKEIE